MKLKDLMLADARIVKNHINITEGQIIFDFQYAFDKLKMEYIDDVRLTISKWEELIIYKHISHDNFKSYHKILVNIKDIEKFAEIQIVKIIDDQLIFEGFSKDSSCWLVYEFTKYESKIECFTN